MHLFLMVYCPISYITILQHFRGWGRMAAGKQLASSWQAVVKAGGKCARRRIRDSCRWRICLESLLSVVPGRYLTGIQCLFCLGLKKLAIAKI